MQIAEWETEEGQGFGEKIIVGLALTPKKQFDGVKLRIVHEYEISFDQRTVLKDKASNVRLCFLVDQDKVETAMENGLNPLVTAIFETPNILPELQVKMPLLFAMFEAMDLAISMNGQTTANKTPPDSSSIKSPRRV